MNRDKKATITVQGTEVILLSHRKEDYISLTDMAKYRNAVEPFSIINNWMRSRSTIEFIGLWEQLNNRDFKPIVSKIGGAHSRGLEQKREVTILFFRRKDG